MHGFAHSLTITSNRPATPKGISTCSAGAPPLLCRQLCHYPMDADKSNCHTTRHTPDRAAYMRAIGRLAESEGSVLFARFDEAEKCEFIEANVLVEAWSPTDDNAGVLIKASELREQAREVLVSVAR